MKVLFDGDEEYINKKESLIEELNLIINYSELIDKSIKLDKITFDKKIKSSSISDIVNSHVLLERYRGPLGLTVYIFEFKNNTLIFEFGEKQPGRYILNQLAIIESDETTIDSNSEQ